MRFGLFDHLDRGDRAFARQLDERLDYVAAADPMGFHCYHVAEHHASALGLASVPSVYLAAVARATRRMRFGTMVYLVPTYSPLRLIEEISMLDQLGHGRFDIGVGRGVPPWEAKYKNAPGLSQELFTETLEAMFKGLTQERLTHSGKHYHYDNTPMELRPVQKPHPPVWYPTSTQNGARFAGSQGFNFCCIGTSAAVAGLVHTYKEALASRGGPRVASPGFPGGAAYGVWRQLVIADTEREAMAIAEDCYRRWIAASHGKPSGHVSPSLEAALKDGALIAGTPDMVRAAIRKQAEETGVNYMTFSCFFGDMTLEAALRTVRLLQSEIAPAFPGALLPQA